MNNIEFINDAGFDRWRDVVQLVGELENWVLSENDLHVWKTGYGKDNFNLIVAVDSKSNKTVGSITSAFYVPVDGSEPLVTVGMFFVCPSHRGTGLGG
uniref:N-acetyltransferase domain-containing protein n=1 Tax=Panagrolaimus sp. JU765 TaxID=591449 RepID=A0AC34RBG8_9BILA